MLRNSIIITAVVRNICSVPRVFFPKSYFTNRQWLMLEKSYLFHGSVFSTMEKLCLRFSTIVVFSLLIGIFISKFCHFPKRLAAINGYGLQIANIITVEPLLVRNSSNIIILTYMRSGSTLLGELFRNHPDVFYFYEPLRRIENR